LEPLEQPELQVLGLELLPGLVQEQVPELEQLHQLKA
jgi:hypothetical protein